MNYLLKSSSSEERRRQARQRLFLTIGVIFLAVIILLTGPAKRVLFFIAEPVWQMETAMGNSSLFSYFRSKQALFDEKIALEQKLFNAGSLLAENEILQTENDYLKDLLGRQTTKQKTVLAAVLVKPPQTPYDQLIIDIGADYAVKVGDQVLANGNIYIGEVSEVESGSAKVDLYSTPDRKLAVSLNGNPATVEAVGMGGGNFSINLPREIDVKEGDAVTIPSITANIFGIVEKVNFRDKDSFQTVLFKSPVNISELSFVQVIVK